MIDPEKHKYHVDILGNIEEFNNMIDDYHMRAPWLSDEEIEDILNEEAEKKIGPSFWYNNA